MKIKRKKKDEKYGWAWENKELKLNIEIIQIEDRLKVEMVYDTPKKNIRNSAKDKKSQW